MEMRCHGPCERAHGATRELAVSDRGCADGSVPLADAPMRAQTTLSPRGKPRGGGAPAPSDAPPRPQETPMVSPPTRVASRDEGSGGRASRTTRARPEAPRQSPGLFKRLFGWAR